MPVIIQPGFLEQAIGQGVSTFQQFRNQRNSERQQKFQNELATQRQMRDDLNTALQSGTSEDVKRVAQLIPSLRGTTFRETPAQLQSRMLGAPEGQGIAAQSMDTGQGFGGRLFIPKVAGKESFSDDQRRVAGLPTALEKKKEKLAGRQTDLAGAQTEDAITNLPRTQQMERMKTLEPVLSSAAERFISAPILKAGGKLNPKQLPALAEQAYNNFLAESKDKPYGNLTPEDATQARSYFDEAVRKAYGEQTDRDIKRLAALPQSAFGQNFNPATMVSALNGLAKAKQDQFDDLFKRNPILGVLQNADPASVPPQMQNLLKEAATMRQQVQQLQSAAAGFGAGTVGVPEAQKLLKQFSTGNVSGVTTAPPAGGGSSAQAEWDRKAVAIKSNPNDPRVKGKTVEQLIGARP